MKVIVYFETHYDNYIKIIRQLEDDIEIKDLMSKAK